MSDYEEWGEGTAGVLAADGNPGDALDWDEYREQAWQRNQREAVVCLVDCNEAMFDWQPDTLLSSSPATAGGTGAVSTDTTCVAAAAAAAAAHDNGSRAAGAPSFFTMTMQGIQALLKEKVVSAGKDVLAIVLYNTRLASSRFGGVYVAQEATQIGTECLQKVEQLAAAGTRCTAAYAEFEERVGHGPARSSAAASPTSPPFRFSEALWEAQRILLSICGSQAIRHRRLLVFTNRDNPSAGERREWLQCCSRASDLGKEGVVLEVFGFGTSTSSQPGGSSLFSTTDVALTEGTGRRSATHMSAAAAPSSYVPITSVSSGAAAPPLFAVSSTSVPSYEPSSVATATSSVGGSATLADSAGPLAAAAACGFVSECFWGPLLRKVQDAAAQCGPDGGADAESALAAAESREAAFVRGGAGAVHVSAGVRTLQQLLSSVVRHAHPQRPFRHCMLRIGSAAGGGGAGGDAVLRMAVSLYTPLMRARPPQREWFDAQTNRMLRRVVHLHAQPAANEDDAEEDGRGDGCGRSTASLRSEDVQRSAAAANAQATSPAGTEVHADDLCYYAVVGKERVYFTKEERRRLVEVAAAGAETGFTVLLFKDADAALRREHVVRRSSFLHACVQRGGPKSHQLFVLFVRRLRATGKVAIAQFRNAAAAAPRLVALVPAPDLTAHPELLDKLPVEGLGLYVMPLPYAEELRPVPSLRMCTLVDKYATPVLPDRAVDPGHRELAARLVEALTVPYQIDAVLNPALQRQYSKLQELARRLYPLADNSLPVAPSSAAVAEAEGVGVGAGDDDDGAAEPQDETRPDYANMQHFAGLFHRFNTEVLGPNYDAGLFCPQPRPTGVGAARRGRAEAGNSAASGGTLFIVQAVCDAAARNAWDGLTIPQLKEYLTVARVSTGGARRKADLLLLVQRHLPPASSSS